VVRLSPGCLLPAAGFRSGLTRWLPD